MRKCLLGISLVLLPVLASCAYSASAHNTPEQQEPEPEAEPKVDEEAAIAAAEEALAAAEEKAVPEGAGAPGQLADAAAEQAVADAAPTTALAGGPV